MNEIRPATRLHGAEAIAVATVHRLALRQRITPTYSAIVTTETARTAHPDQIYLDPTCECGYTAAEVGVGSGRYLCIWCGASTHPDDPLVQGVGGFVALVQRAAEEADAKGTVLRLPGMQS